MVVISDQLFGSMSHKSTTYALFTLRMLMENYKEAQKDLHRVCRLRKKNLMKECHEVWYCMKKSGVAGKYTKAVLDMHEGNETMVCAVRVTRGFKIVDYI